MCLFMYTMYRRPPPSSGWSPGWVHRPPPGHPPGPPPGWVQHPPPPGWVPPQQHPQLQHPQLLPQGEAIGSESDNNQDPPSNDIKSVLNEIKEIREQLKLLVAKPQGESQNVGGRRSRRRVKKMRRSKKRRSSRNRSSRK